MEKGPGCRIVLALLFALIAASFIFQGNQCGAQNAQGQNPNDPGVAVAKVGELPVSERAIMATAEQQKQSTIASMGTYPPAMEAQNLAGATFNEVERLLLIELAKRKGISLDEKTIRTTLDADWTQGLEAAKAQLMATGKLKPTSSEADFQAAYKEMSGGKSPEDAKAEQDKLVTEYLADPARLPLLQAGTANRALVQHFQKETAPTDAQLKDSYTTFVMKRVWLDSTKNKGVDMAKKLEEIKAEISSGKLTFEQAMNKYSNDIPAAKKTVSESTFELDGRTRSVDPEYKGVQNLKPGEISGVLTFNNGAAIFKMLTTKSELPTDFDKKKEDYRKSFSEATAAKALQDELTKVRSEGLVKWEDPAFKVLYAWFNTKMNPTLIPKEPAARNKFYDDLFTEAKAAYDGAKGSPSVAAFAMFGIDTELYGLLPEAEKTKAADRRIEVLNAVLQFTESTPLRLELVDLLIAKKDKKGVSEQLVNAGIANQDLGPGGQKDFGDISAKMEAAETAGLLEPDSKKKLDEIQLQWKTQKIEKDKFEAEEKARMEAERKKAEAEEKANKEKEKNAKPIDRAQTPQKK